MKQNMKRVLLALCMVTCLFSLSACTKKAADAAAEIDPSKSSYITQVTEDLLQQITALSGTDAEETETALRESDQKALANGVASWTTVMDDTGALVSVVSSTVEETEEGYACVTVADFANRRAEFKMIYAESGQNLMPLSVSFTPEYTTGEKMSKAAMNTLMGMGTVFCVLIFISILIGGFKYINAFERKMREKNAAPEPVSEVKAAEPVMAEPEEEDLTDDLELVAVITAAIAASAGTSADGLVVRSIKRASGAKWKRA